MKMVDKENLSCAIQHIIQDVEGNKSRVLHWGQCLDIPSLQKLSLMNDIGNFAIPISKKDIENTLINKGGMDSINLDAGSKQLVEETFHKYAVSAVKKMTDGREVWNEVVDLGLQFNQLAIIPAGEIYREETSHTKPGLRSIGKYFVILPIEGGYSGKVLEVENLNKEDLYDNQRNKRHLFYSFSFFTASKHKWIPVKYGSLVLLVFEIVWRPSLVSVTSSIGLPSFIAATHKIREILSSWNSKLEHEFQAKDFKPEVFIIPLNENYEECNFSFSSLLGKDRQIAQVLQTIDFIDVHLATVDTSSDGISLQITQLFLSDYSVPHFDNNELKVQLIGELETCLSTRSSAADSGNGVANETYPVLVIQPRHSSIRRCCLSLFDAALSFLESQLTRSAHSDIARLHSRICLEHVLSYCHEKPLNVWDVSEAKATERTLRLLKICLRLKAGKEGLFLVTILGDVLEKPSAKHIHSNPPTLNKGVSNDGVARSIIDIVRNLGGWSVFCDPVLRLISSKHIIRQMKTFTEMVLVLLEYRCVSAATDIAQRISFVIEFNKNLVPQLRREDINAHVDAVIGIEVHSDARDERLLEKLIVPIFKLLLPSQKCQLLIDLGEAGNYCRFKGLASCLELYEKLMAKYLTQKDLCELNDQKILKEFISMVFCCTGDKKMCFIGFDKILKSSTSSPLVKSTMNKILNKNDEEENLRTGTSIVDFHPILSQLRLFPRSISDVMEILDRDGNPKSKLLLLQDMHRKLEEDEDSVIFTPCPEKKFTLIEISD